MSSRSTTEPFEVPVIDITPYVDGGTEAQRARVAREIDDACTRVGFVTPGCRKGGSPPGPR